MPGRRTERTDGPVIAVTRARLNAVNQTLGPFGPSTPRRPGQAVHVRRRQHVGLMALPVPQTLVNAGAVEPVRTNEVTPDREAEQIDNLRTILAAAGRGGLG
jgi:hypothetical protein